MDIMQFLTPITKENLCELQPGEWIWDGYLTARRVHKRSLGDEFINEPIGFRQIDILDLELYPRYSSKPFLLTNLHSDRGYSASWEYFEEGRFFMFKRNISALEEVSCENCRYESVSPQENPCFSCYDHSCWKSKEE